MKKEYIKPEIEAIQFLLPGDIMNECMSPVMGDNDNTSDDDEEEESGEAGAKSFDGGFDPDAFEHDWDFE